VDSRCYYVEEYDGYDCPGGWQNNKDGTWIPRADKKGAGNLQPGNPNKTFLGGGGAGCHFNKMGNSIDQFDAYAGPPGSANIVQSYNCECNYSLKTNWWQDWVKQWMAHAHNKVYTDHRYDWMGWFSHGRGTPSWGVDLAACWVNNPRDMIQIQNAMWWFKDTWNNLYVPQSLKLDEYHPEAQRRYWGWNEVPVSNTQVLNASHWDAVFIKLPPSACGDSGKQDKMSCLTSPAALRLESLIDWYVSRKYLLPGAANIKKRPGSYVVLLREWYAGKKHWQREFFCDSWTSSAPARKYNIVFEPISSSSKQGVCYIDYGRPPAPPPPAPAPAPIKGGPIRLKAAPTKCMDLTGGDLQSGNKIQIWDCNGIEINQNWIYSEGALRSGVDQSKCVDLGNMQPGTPIAIEACNGSLQQKLIYDTSNSYRVYNNRVCIDLSGGLKSNGNILQVWNCTKGNDNQMWTAALLRALP